MAQGGQSERRVRVTTGDMAYGPHAVARLDGKVLFVRGAAPDEEIEAVVREERRAYAYADTAAVLRPSTVRRPAPCPYLPRCGGCPWQHLDYAAQLDAKRQLVREHLRRIGGLDVAVEPVLPSPREYGYRRRVKLRVEAGEVGFYAAASHRLVPIAHCMLAEAPVDAGIAWAGELVRVLTSHLRRVELMGRAADDPALVIVGEVEGAWRPRDESACRTWLAAHPSVAGLVLQGRGWRRQWGDVHVAFAPEPALDLHARAPAFTQVNPAANQLLVETVVRLAGARPAMAVLDLYAGAGNLSLPLRRRGAAVVAVEQDRRAAADAEANAARVAGPPFRVIAGRAEHALVALLEEGARFDLAVLDPPRSGAAACAAPLLRLAPPALIYVSCDPATLARDLAALRGRYAIDVVQPIDMFPHSYHIETVVRATLSCDPGTPGVSSSARHESVEPRRHRRTS